MKKEEEEEEEEEMGTKKRIGISESISVFLRLIADLDIFYSFPVFFFKRKIFHLILTRLDGH